METTDHYWLALYNFLVEHNFVIHLINPIQTNGWHNATQIRKHKTDTIDSLIIADFIRYGNLEETQLACEETLELRDLTRFRNYQVSSISDLKRKTICALDQVFHEYEKIFSDVFDKTSKEILITFESVSNFAYILFLKISIFSHHSIVDL